jgi:ATP-dependent helicase/nuclease subunit A
MGCHLYGIAPDFTQDEKAVKKSIENLALPFILEHRDSPAIKALVKTKDYAQITNELFVEPFMADSTIAEPIDFEKGLLLY